MAGDMPGNGSPVEGSGESPGNASPAGTGDEAIIEWQVTSLNVVVWWNTGWGRQSIMNLGMLVPPMSTGLLLLLYFLRFWHWDGGDEGAKEVGVDRVAEGGESLVPATVKGLKPENYGSGSWSSFSKDCSDGEGETHARMPKPKRRGRWSLT